MKKIILFLLFAACAPAKDSDWFHGNWKGTGLQIDGKKWEMELNAGSSSVQVNYPSLYCSGKWEIIKQSGRKLVLKETIEQGADKCDQGNEVIISSLNGKMQVVFYNKGLGYKDAIANAVLEPVK